MRQQMPCPAWRWMLFTLVTGRPLTSPEWLKRNKRNQSCRMPRIPRSSCVWFTYLVHLPTVDACHLAVRHEHGHIMTLRPQPFCQAVFHALHFLSHLGIRATQRLVTAHYVWPRINTDVRQWACSCLQCQRTKVQQHTVTSPGTFALMRNLITSTLTWWDPCLPGYSYLLTCPPRD